MAGVIIYNKSTNRYVYSVNADLSKLINGGVDVSLTSALPEHVAKGQWFYTADGELCEGTVETMEFQDTAIVPTTTRQVFQTTGKILTSDVIVAGDANLNANNIKKGVSIFGVEGVFGPYDGTTLIQSVVPPGYHYYDATGELVEGTAPVLDGLTITPGEMEQRIASGRYIASDIVIAGEPNLDTHNWLDTITIFGRQGSIPTYNGSNEFIPSTQEQVIYGGVYLSADLRISGDVNLSAHNIAEGVSIFGVVGTLHVPEYGTYACEAHEVLKGSTFINKQGEVGEGGIEYYTGSHEIQPGPTEQILDTAQRYIEQAIVVDGDEYLRAENIIEGVTIFGVTGAAPYVPEIDRITVDESKVVSGELFIGRDKTLCTGGMPTFDQPGMPYSQLQPYCQSYEYPDHRNVTDYLACSGSYFFNDVQIIYCDTFLPENIKEGVDMWGVIGTYSGEGADFSQVTVEPSQVLLGCPFYNSNGELVVGEIPTFNGEYVSPSSPYADSDYVVVPAGNYIGSDLKIPACRSFTHPEMWLPDCDLWGYSGEMSTIGNGTYDSPQTYAIDGLLQNTTGGDITIVEAHQFSYDNIIIPYEPNFIPENIVKGVTIWGVEGTYEFDMSMLSIVPEHMVPEGYSYMDCERYQKYGTAKIAQDGPVWPDGSQQIIIGESTFVEVNGQDKYGIWIEAEPNFVPENIKKGVYIWGVEGTYEGEGGSSGDGSGDGESPGSGSSGELVFIARDLNYIRENMAYGSGGTIWFGAMGMINACPSDSITAAGVDLYDNAAFCAFLAETLNSFTGSGSYSDDAAYNWEYSSTYDTLVCRTMNSSGKQAPVLFSVFDNNAMACFFEIEFN